MARHDTIHFSRVPTAPSPSHRPTCLEELGRELDEPLGVDLHDGAHVLLGRQHQLVVEQPLRALVEQRRRRVDVLCGGGGCVGWREVGLVGWWVISTPSSSSSSSSSRTTTATAGEAAGESSAHPELITPPPLLAHPAPSRTPQPPHSTHSPLHQPPHPPTYHDGVLEDGAVPLLRVLLGHVREVARADGLLHLLVVPPCGGCGCG